MSRYYFHLRFEDEVIADQEGLDLPDTATARREALAAARQILADSIKSGRENIPDAFIVADSEGRELETIPLAAALPICIARAFAPYWADNVAIMKKDAAQGR
jgi:hypothetical protein